MGFAFARDKFFFVALNQTKTKQLQRYSLSHFAVEEMCWIPKWAERERERNEKKHRLKNSDKRKWNAQYAKHLHDERLFEVAPDGICTYCVMRVLFLFCFIIRRRSEKMQWNGYLFLRILSKWSNKKRTLAR